MVSGPILVRGRPPKPLSVRRVFWRAVMAGSLIEQAALAAGVSEVIGRGWFAKAGGVPPIDRGEPSGRYLSFQEREEIAIFREQRVGVREIARRLGRCPSTISRELRRNIGPGGADRSGRYRASTATARAEARARRPKPSKVAVNQRLRDYVQDKLTCREHWSPEQISGRLPLDFPDDDRMRVSHEAIYQALYVQGRGALRRELTVCLRTGRAVRRPRRSPDTRRNRVIPPQLLISERPAEVGDRAVPGHWEGDLVLGEGNTSAVGTLVERQTRYLMLLHLPSDHRAETVRDAIASTIVTLPAQLRRTLTWDQGSELAQHAQLSIDTGLHIYFCDPHSPWQRGTNENTNGLLRQYLPKGTNLSRHTAGDLDDIAAALNGRPRKTLGFRTPAEALNELLLSTTNPVATTP
jgi:IS30 family transposase